ncbi:MAG TPA: class D sortase [Terriglobales bacterium]|jgi:sortase A|nr:class D sortase [Terriglobales bacterium]
MEVIDQSPAKDSVLYGRISQFWRKFLPALRRQKLSVILMVAGAGLLTYVGLQYWAMYHEQRALQREWQEQQKPSAGVAIGESLSKDDGLTRVSIPKINLDVIVVEGTNHRALRIGPGHLKNTPIPGELGNSVISAHRDTFFRHIYELNRGDEIEVRRNGRTYTFEVTGKKIVMPNDLSVVKNSSDARLTLITCYPIYYIGPAPQRLVVVSRLVGDAQNQQQRAEVPPSSRQGS